MRRLWSLILTLSFPFMAFAANNAVVSGTVKDGSGKPLPSVMVRVIDGGSAGRFTMTGASGGYSLDIAVGDSVVAIRYSKLGYEAETAIVENKSQRLDMVLSGSASTLREVTVKAPDVRIMGDTVSYLLSAFMGKGDVSLKDALKRVPGVEVAKSGEISYNGKKISNFYIEGLDLLGGRYDAATTNLPASYVNAIEIINNHQDMKIDRGVFSDNVALNVRLKRKSMFRPVGTYGVRGGCGRRIPVEASGAGMLFRDNLQTMLTIKGGDIAEFSERENTRFYDGGGEKLKNLASEAVGTLSSSSPPLERGRWIEPWDASAGVNFINKVNDDRSIRVNAGYSFLETECRYSDMRMYFDGGGDIVISRRTEPESRRHVPSFSMEYRNNGDDVFLSNDFSGKAAFCDRSMPVFSLESDISQCQGTVDFGFRDVMDLRWRRGKIRWNFSSVAEYRSSPKWLVDASGESFGLSQRGSSRSFVVRETFGGVLEKRHSRFSFLFNAGYVSDRVRTDLCFYNSKDELDAKNRIKGSSFRFNFSPGYEYSSDYDRFVLRLSCPLGFEYVDWNNSGSVPYEEKGVHFTISPSVYANYKMSGASTLRASASYSRECGDILDLLTAPVMKDYLSMHYRSGWLAENRNFEAALHYGLNLPVSQWFYNADVRYLATHSNLVDSRMVASSLIASTDLLMPHLSETVVCSAGVSKNIGILKLKARLRCSYNWNRNTVEQNGLPVVYYGQLLTVSPSFSGNPTSWLSFSYEGSFFTNYSRYLGIRRSFSGQDHNLSVSFFPIEVLEVNGGLDVAGREIEEKRYKTISLLDAGMAYKAGKFRLTFKVRNLLDAGSWSYSVFNGVDRFVYDFSLRGREFIAGVEYRL